MTEASIKRAFMEEAFRSNALYPLACQQSSPGLRTLLSSLLSRWALLKTREKFWGEYENSTRWEYWRDCPAMYRRLSPEREPGIEIPDISPAIAYLLLDYCTLRLKEGEMMKSRTDSRRRFRSPSSGSPAIRKQMGNILGVLERKWHFCI